MLFVKPVLYLRTQKLQDSVHHDAWTKNQFATALVSFTESETVEHIEQGQERN